MHRQFGPPGPASGRRGPVPFASMAAGSPDRARTRWPTIGELWAFLAIALPGLAALMVPMPAVDLAYQLRAGADILAGNGIPTMDTWTFTVSGTPWLDQQWGAQVLLAAVYQATSWTGLAILRATLVGLTFGLTFAALRISWSVASTRAGGSSIASSSRTAALIVLGAFAVAAPALALRPQLFAIPLFAATVLILAERGRHPRRLWFIPFIAAAWANLHGSFPLVLVLIALAWVDEVALLRMPVPAGHARLPLPRRLLGSTGIALIGAFSALATLLTPFGIDAWRYIENLARNPEITSAVSEWRAPSPFDPAGAVFYLSLLLVVGVIAYRIRSDRGRTPPQFVAPILTVLVFGGLGVVTGRGLAWWSIAGVVAVVALQPGLKLADVRLPRVPALRARTAREASLSESRRSPLNALVVVLLAALAVMLLPVWRPVGRAGVPVGTLTHAPQDLAVSIPVRLSRFSVSAWVPQAWGSWFEFAQPDVAVAVDSRIELYPEFVWADAELVATASGDWLGVLDRYHADVVVVAADQVALEAGLAKAPAWQRIYFDNDGSVWQRR